MLVDWNTIPLGDFVTLQRGHDLPETDRVPGPIPVLGSFGVTGFHNTWKASGPGVTIGRSGSSFGVVSYTQQDYWPLNTVLYVTDFHDNDALFAYYLLKSIDFSGFNSGSAQPSLNRNYIYPIPLKIPGIQEQRSIARILRALDDKIELNRRMNETLESMARAIFKSWFVDFDPVRAKAEGRRPAGMDADTAALFPSAFQSSGPVKIPVGWSWRPIGDLVKVVGGSTPRTDQAEYWNGGSIPFATPKDLAGLTSPILLSTERCITQEGAEQINSGILPSGTVLLSSRAPIGYLAITAIDLCVNQGFIAMICSRGFPNYYALYWAESNMDTIIARANGTTFLEISKGNFRSIPVLVPGDAIITRFQQHVELLFSKIILNQRQCETLMRLGDVLLPKLLSGAIRISNERGELQDRATRIGR